MKIKKEVGCIWSYGMVFFKCISISSQLGRGVCPTLKYV